MIDWMGSPFRFEPFACNIAIDLPYLHISKKGGMLHPDLTTQENVTKSLGKKKIARIEIFYFSYLGST